MNSESKRLRPFEMYLEGNDQNEINYQWCAIAEETLESSTRLIKRNLNIFISAAKR